MPKSYKTRRVSNLYFQFGSLLQKPKLSADQIADALARAGLIEVTEYDQYRKPVRYRETPAMHALPREAFRECIGAALKQWCAVEGHVLG